MSKPLIPRYSAIPAVPIIGVDEWLSQILNSLKENTELLIGARDEGDRASEVLNRSSITVSYPPAQTMQRVKAEGSGVSISGADVPTHGDYVKLLLDVQALANDVANLHQTVAILISQLKV